jgi:hypothetical protein
MKRNKKSSDGGNHLSDAWMAATIQNRTESIYSLTEFTADVNFDFEGVLK